MSIYATANETKRELVPAGNYPARCFQMIHIGTIQEAYMGEPKIVNKVRIGWELPTEQKVFREERGEEPFVISQDYTLSMGEKANLRKMLESWRGKGFSDDEAKKFDITKLLGVTCMLNIIHKPKQSDPSTQYATIASVTPIPKGMTIPKQINEMQVWEYDKPNYGTLEKLPDFLKDKIKSSLEYERLKQPNASHVNASDITEPIDDLPF